MTQPGNIQTTEPAVARRERDIVVVTSDAEQCTRAESDHEHPRAHHWRKRAGYPDVEQRVRFQLVSGKGINQGLVVCHGCATPEERSAIAYELKRVTTLASSELPNRIAVIAFDRVKAEAERLNVASDEPAERSDAIPPPSLARAAAASEVARPMVVVSVDESSIEGPDGATEVETLSTPSPIAAPSFTAEAEPELALPARAKLADRRWVLVTAACGLLAVIALVSWWLMRRGR